MATNTVFFCKECGYESAKWLGKCPGCNSWNSFVEEKINKQSKSKASSKGFSNTFNNKSEVKKLNDIIINKSIRLDTGYAELNRVFGGGIVEGSLTLIGGEPGIGKSTLIMQVCNKLSNHGKVLYVSGEESETQVKLRADRLKVSSDNILFLSETDISQIENKIEETEPKFCIIDSIQTMYDEDISSVPGSISQVKEVTARMMYLAKRKNITVIVIGHVTKDGVIAGPRILEHMVDTVLYIEGERFFTHRIIRSVKNRFGSTNEIGIFEMKNGGLSEVANPSEIFLEERLKGATGSAVVASLEGTRPILVELQALVTPTAFGNAKRTTTGLDHNRVALLMAVLEKRAGLLLQNQDAYLKAAGGVKLDEPAIDLAIAVSLVSSYRDAETRPTDCFIGEVGLTGEIRRVNRIEQRVVEAAKLGFKRVFLPKNNLDGWMPPKEIEVVGVSTLNQALKLIFS